MVAWHEVPGIAADYDPSRRDGMIERDSDDVIVTEGSQKRELRLVGKIRLARSNRQLYRPFGTDSLEGRLPRHFVPGYHRLSLRDRRAPFFDSLLG